MKTTLVFLASLLTVAASAAPSLTVQQEVTLASALSALDGHTSIIKVNGQDSAVNVAYTFSGDVRWKIRDDLAALQPKVDAFQKVQQDVLKEVSGGKGFIAPTDATGQATYAMKVDEAGKHVDENPPKLQTFTRADLNLNDNPIPGTVLNALAPLIQ